MYQANDPTPCKELEQLGASLLVWVMNVKGSFKLVIKRSTGEYITVDSFLLAYGCGGPTAQLLRSQLGRVITAASRQPSAFQRFSTSGASLNQVFRTSDEVLKNH